MADDINLAPAAGDNGSVPNPSRDPNGLLLTGDIERGTTVANHTADNVPMIKINKPEEGLCTWCRAPLQVWAS